MQCTHVASTQDSWVKFTYNLNMYIQSDNVYTLSRLNVHTVRLRVHSQVMCTHSQATFIHRLVTCTHSAGSMYTQLGYVYTQGGNKNVNTLLSLML